jgi:hypothetical protein
MMANLSYVKWIQENKITLFCDDIVSESLLKKIGAKRKFFDRKIWLINFKDERGLADKLQQLNENGFMFAGGSHGWNPIDIFILMREKNLVTGKVTEIVWNGKNQTLTRIL